jgi:hypothetical protein
LANKRPEHGIDSSFTLLVALEFFECFAVAESHDHTEIEGLFQAGPIHRQRTTDAHIINAASASESAQGTQKIILIIGISRALQPKKHHVRDLAGAGNRSLRAGRRDREGKCEAAQKYRDAHTEEERKIHFAGSVSSLKISRPASNLN